ncbi:MAG TPA: HDIG domain-containing protein [Planctomycetota bacterium]|nr:HDIG domain-containing protein [Planctomycetota bacterium]
MAKKKRRLDQFLGPRRASTESVLVERAQLANRVFRFSVGMLLTFLLALLTSVPEPAYTVGLALFLLIFTLLGGLCLHRLQPGVFDRPASFNKFVLLVLFTLGVYRFIIFMEWSPLLLPLPMFGMIVALTHSLPTALVSVLAMTFIVGLTSPRIEGISEVAPFPPGLPVLVRIDLPLTLALAVGAVTAILGVRRVREQSKPVFVGFYSGIVQALMVLGFELMSPGFRVEVLRNPAGLRVLLEDPGWAFTGGLISGAIVTCLLPTFERFFGFVTERRLLGLADPSNKLLQVLRERAPGTYQHTLNVSQLASAAAEAIGGDRLLAEVGALYHDVGKINKPEYFVENMGENRRIHDRLRPSMSKMIIISHVKEGLLLAREERLPQKLLDMIPMHHGTTVVEYFFHKARREVVEAEDAPSDTEYRYPGPRPRFREAGILMLADMVEAIAKTEAEPNPSRFRTMVHDQILKRLLDGQLDESDLTLNDLRVIEDSFVRTLTTMYHSRIKYPAPETGTGREGDGPAGASAQPAEDAVKVQRSSAAI